MYYGKVDARGTPEKCHDCGAEVRKDLSTRIHHCHNCGSTKPRDVASGQVICSRGQRQIENACGVEATGDRVTDSSWLAMKQEIFEATQGISLHTRNGLLGEDVNLVVSHPRAQPP
ncbi:transposase [Baaleninema simplex]|uniref:transposase n=1 Tax=Baaleninema simplex TaxID=2862350 RepID=UPI000348EC30|nr:transposase [Baaleninema simplex]